MSRQKDDGRGRLGGRQKGTPNKVTASVKEWLGQLIDKNRRQIERDLKGLEPKDRLQIMERLMAYVVPKQQAVKTEIDITRLSDEQLDEVIQGLANDIISDEN